MLVILQLDAKVESWIGGPFDRENGVKESHDGFEEGGRVAEKEGVVEVQVNQNRTRVIVEGIDCRV